MEQIRAFIATELPDEVRAALDQLQNGLKSERRSFVRWVHPEGIHLTLKFLGNIGAGKVPEIIEAMAKACRGVTSFHLALNGLGVFPNFRSPRVVWVGLVGEVEKLSALQECLEQALEPLGFAPEDRAFTPHLTLGRLRDGTTREERLRFGELVTSMRSGGMPSFEVSAISLMRSELMPSGAVYSRLQSVSLEEVQ